LTNDKKLFLELIADVQPDYGISPPVLDFAQEMDTVQCVSVKPRFAEDIRVLDISCTRSYYDVETVKSDPAESVVKVTFLPEKKLSGEKEAILELKTSNTRQPVHQISLFCAP
jgi:hypothetical protein